MSKLRHPSRSQVLRDYLDWVSSADYGVLAGQERFPRLGQSWVEVPWRAARKPPNRVSAPSRAPGRARTTSPAISPLSPDSSTGHRDER